MFQRNNGEDNIPPARIAAPGNEHIQENNAAQQENPRDIDNYDDTAASAYFNERIVVPSDSETTYCVSVVTYIDIIQLYYECLNI